MYQIGIKYKIQAIRTSDVAICFEKWRQTRVQALREVNKNSNFTSFGWIWLNLVRLVYFYYRFSDANRQKRISDS